VGHRPEAVALIWQPTVAPVPFPGGRVGTDWPCEGIVVTSARTVNAMCSNGNRRLWLPAAGPYREPDQRQPEGSRDGYVDRMWPALWAGAIRA